MKYKGTLQKLIDKNFGGKWWRAADEMVSMFCQKYNIPGSAGHDFYTPVKKVWENELKEERERIEKWEKYEKEAKKMGW